MEDTWNYLRIISNGGLCISGAETSISTITRVKYRQAHNLRITYFCFTRD
jgi:hypothetical protein